MLEERQLFGDGYLRRGNRHHIRDDGELYGAGDAGHRNDRDDDDEIDDKEVHREDGAQKANLLRRALRADAVRPQRPTARRAPAVVGAN